MERNRPKSKGPKNGVQAVQKTPERSSFQQAVPEKLVDMLLSQGWEVHLRGSGKQVEKMVHLEHLLSAAQIHFIRKDYRDDAISLFVTVPGQRWEVDVMEDGEVEWECFKSGGDIFDESEMRESIGEFAEPA